MRIEPKRNPLGRNIYTLAVDRTPLYVKLPRTPIIIVKGKGANIANNVGLQKWAKRKMISRALVLKLIDVAKEYGDTEFIQKCWNAYHCLGKIYTTGGRLHGDYCKHRFCPLCCGIHKADMINRYYPYFKREWEHPYFVTLTVKSPKAKNLKKIVDAMCRAMSKIIDKYNRGYKKGKCSRLIGIRALECGFNPDKHTYNPHFHIIVKNKEIAETLKKEWCKLWTLRYANPAAQKVKRVWDMQGALIELIKYCGKIFTEPEYDKKLQGMAKPIIYAHALYNILKVLEKKHVFEPFGFTLPKQPKKGTFTPVSDYKKWHLDPKTGDYVNEDLDFPLIGFEKPPELEHLLEKCIDTVLA